MRDVDTERGFHLFFGHYIETLTESDYSVVKSVASVPSF